ncbi:MAG: molybdenum cofactor guanylyltransferase [Acidiphilium sp.]|nr:molybdenum cofactor guanylyltransferase [Acidiphilium sp.]MDD4934589.1 molybdenum cofactor guanylyltransferase [Acidiphilium sp.]
MTGIYGLILAGGQGRRLGGVDKAFLRLHDRPMITHVIDRLGGQTDGFAISAAGDGARFAAFGVPVVGDGMHWGKGPLAGVLAGLIWAQTRGGVALLTVPVDTPFVPRDLVACLAPAPSVAAHQGRVHHLVALWPVTAIGALDEFLAGAGPYRVSDFARAIGLRVVGFDAELDPFLNINTPTDRTVAEAREC